MSDVTVLDHPLLRHKMALLRDKNTTTAMFRQIAREISLLMAYEVTRDLPLEPIDIETPLESMRAEHLAGKKLCLVSILRAGNGILEGMLDLVPSARAYRAVPRSRDTAAGGVLFEAAERCGGTVSDPGGSDAGDGAIGGGGGFEIEAGGRHGDEVRVPVGGARGCRGVIQAHSDVPVFTGAIDRELDCNGYIRPALGDAGDRFYGTR